MEPVAEHRDVERVRWDFFQSIPRLDRDALPHDTVKGSQVLKPLFEFSGACGWLRRDAVYPPRESALRRPFDRRQRHRVFIHLRSEPADDPVDGERRRTGTGVEQFAVRGQRGIRPRDAARPGRPDRSGAPAAGAPRPRDRRGTGARDPGRPRPGDRARDRRPALLAWIGSANGAGTDRWSGSGRCPTPAGTRQRPRPPGSVDHRRRRLGVRHRFRRRRPGPVVGSERQHPGPRHRGLFQHRWPVLEVDAARRRRQVRRSRQGHGQEGPRRDRPVVRQRLRRAESRWARTTNRPPERCSKPTPGRVPHS